MPLYYEHDQLFNVVKCSVPKSMAVKSAILNAGYKVSEEDVLSAFLVSERNGYGGIKVSGSHCNPRALKTDAPTRFLWDICRFAVSLWQGGATVGILELFWLLLQRLESEESAIFAGERSQRASGTTR